MSGHSKWSQIKHKKGATDAKRAQLFSKLSRMISAQAKVAKGDRNSPTLRAAIEKAREANMTNDVIERAVSKATESKEMESITYEAYGPGGVGIIIEALTDNRNKAAAEIRHLLSKKGFALAGIGSVTWSFERVGTEWKATSFVELSDDDAEALGELVDAIEENDEVHAVYTNAHEGE